MLSESQKYEKVWENDAYREWAPGQDFARKFLSVARPFPHSTIVDYGAGTGRGAANIRNLSGCSVTMLDFAPNCLDQKVTDMLGEGFRFVQHDLTKPFDEKSDFGYCTDVMEHIPPKDVDKVLKNDRHPLEGARGPRDARCQSADEREHALGEGRLLVQLLRGRAGPRGRR